MRKILAFIMALTLVFSLVACGGSDDTTETTTGEATVTTTEGESSSSDEEITISFMHFYNEEDRATDNGVDSFRTVMENWLADHPNVKLEESTMAQTDFATKIQALAAAEDLPDMFFVKGSWMTNFQNSDLLMPLNDIIDNYEHKDKIYPSAFDACTDDDGNIYGIPNQQSLTSLVYYNAELWKQAGFDEFPKTWAEVEQAAEYFQQNDIVPFALGNKDLWPSESCWLSAVGDRYTDTEWTNKIIAGDPSAKFTDPDFVASLQFMADLAPILNEDYNSIGNTQANEFYYCTGKAATMVEGQWAIGTINASADENVVKNTKIALLPTVDGGKGRANVSSGGYGWFASINSQIEPGAKLDAIASLLMDTGCYEMSKHYLENYGLVGTCQVDDPDLSKVSDLAQQYTALADQLDGLVPTYDLLMEASVIEVMNTGLQEVLNGTKTPEDLAQEIQAEQEKIYE
jgi:ABC-type glycerol-3-phosphate transport system substrate-binding protein